MRGYRGKLRPPKSECTKAWSWSYSPAKGPEQVDVPPLSKSTHVNKCLKPGQELGLEGIPTPPGMQRV